MLSLAVVAGPWSGRSLPLGDVVVGRDPACGLVLPADDVSRRHVRVTGHDGVARVCDLGSVNGTWLDGHRLGPSPQQAPPGTTLRIGESTVLVEDHCRTEGTDPVALARRGPAATTAPVGLGHTGTGRRIEVDLRLATLGLVGPHAATAPLARWLLAQSAARVVPVLGPRAVDRWAWLPQAGTGDLGAVLAAAARVHAGTGAWTVMLVDLDDPREPRLPALPRPGVTALVLDRAGRPGPRLCGQVAVLGADARMRLDGGPEFVVDGVDEAWSRRWLSPT